HLTVHSHRPPLLVPPLPTRRSSDLRDGRLKWIISMAIAVSGTLIQNTSRQSRSSQTMKMPYSGPSTLPSSWAAPIPPSTPARLRSEEHTSELQSRENLVCRLLLEKK